MSDIEKVSEGLSYKTLSGAFRAHNLFDNKTWRYSPKAFPLSSAQVEQLEQIGQACFEFYKAQETLYLRSAEDKNLLRNRMLKAPWVAAYLDRGKPEKLIRHARAKGLRGSMPIVIRPDLLVTETGFAMTEIDSVPGGIGLTAFLNRLYTTLHGEALIGAGEQEMVAAFYEVLASRAPNVSSPFIAILVSDEAATYRPEMEWLASQARQQGRRIYVFHPDEVIPLGEDICVDIDGDPKKVDVIYRFWELFDLANVSIADFLLKALESSQVRLTPPMRAFQEEKLSLALFHHHILDEYWRESLTKNAYKTLSEVIPKTWVIDPVKLPPNAVLNAPYVSGKPLTDWSELIEASQKERNLIIKISGFHQNAWGARSVTLGSDSSRAEWESAIQEAIAMSDTSLHILQTYKKPKRLSHRIYNSDGSQQEMEGRMRLCPYFFVDEQAKSARLHGVLATLCPADKKIIHGMKDAALLPCVRTD